MGVAKDPDAKGGHGITLAAGAEEVDKAFKGRLAATLAALGATGKADEVTKVASLGAVSAPVVVAVGLGAATTAQDASGRTPPSRAAGAAARALAGTASVGLALPAADETEVAAIAEGALLGAYSYTRYRAGHLRRAEGAGRERSPWSAPRRGTAPSRRR